jgi:hypothetical protein
MYLFYTIFIILLFLSIKWEIDDNKRIVKLKNIDQINGEKEKEIYYKFLAKFPYENGIEWRVTYITSIICTLLIWFLCKTFNPNIKITIEFLFIVFFFINVSFFLSSGFNKFHFYRILASKADTNITVI